ncbi:hypothetical protein E8E12_009798 [Didymella heteroderae]|uniref:Uncharacterized protein n=1 Tax=Didymella heteroderae TaxID=1769908 RepID=A0A9P5C6P3_9PLEO|nr:hypothetical protein E8E12_009798 [Didymella heteroderae]
MLVPATQHPLHHLTAQNAQSALLLLPAELRIEIWNLASGNNLIDILYETSNELITTSSFHFDSHKAFRKFVLSRPDIVGKIHHLRIKCRVTGLNNIPTRRVNILDWAKVLTPSYISRFTALQTVVLKLMFNLPNALVRNLNVMDSHTWRGRRLPNIIRAFQQHELRQGTTGAVELYTGWNGGANGVAFGRAVKNELLRHQKRRYPKRGSEAECNGMD